MNFIRKTVRLLKKEVLSTPEVLGTSGVPSTGGGQAGFTLVELLIAMTIFVSFLVVVSNSYLSIIRAQKTANETRQMYSEMRNFVDFVNGEMREGSIDYFCYDDTSKANMDTYAGARSRCSGDHSISAGDNLRTLSKDGLQASVIYFGTQAGAAEKTVMVQKFKNDNGSWVPAEGYSTPQVYAFSNLLVKDLRFEIYPKKDPAKIDNKDLSNQLQPMVKMNVSVASKSAAVKFDLDFQTMITSRAL